MTRHPKIRPVKSRHLNIAALTFALLSLLLVPLASADHERGDLRYRGASQDRYADLAYQLDAAAYNAYRLSDRRSSRDLDAAFERFNDATDRYLDTVNSRRAGANEVDRSFALVTRRYYELRGEFSHYHGGRDLRSAFHRINTPMERLYRAHTGRDLYRDDPNVRHASRVEPRGRHDSPRDRHVDRRDRGHDGRGHADRDREDRGRNDRGHTDRGGSRRTRGRGHH